MAVNGACNTPAIKPVIPIKVKFDSEILKSRPKLLMIFAYTFPKALPITNVGIKIPPTPPAENVMVIATALKIVIPINNKMIIQIFSLK